MFKVLMTTASLVAISAFAETPNPFLSEWTTPSGLPPFGEIRNEHFLPAVKAGLAEDMRAIDAIVENAEQPTFANTIGALEDTGPILDRVGSVFGTLMGCERTDELDAIQLEMNPLYVAHHAAIIAKTQLFQRVSAVYKGDQSGLTTEEKRILEDSYRGFRRSGAELDAAGQARLKEINLAMAELTRRFSKNVLDEDNAFRKTFGVSVADYPKLMSTTEDRSLRERMCRFYTGRCSRGDAHDNRTIAVEMLKFRLEKARLLGYASSAEFFIEPRMAKEAAVVKRFLDDVMKASNAKTKLERAELQKLMDADVAAGRLPAGSKLCPWDWWYYAERLRKERYDIDDELLKRYFRLEDVTRGMFRAAERLYGLRVEPLADAPSYNPKETKAYRIADADGSLVGLFITDFRARPTKANGAWKSSLRPQYVDAKGGDVRPIVINVANMGDRLTCRDVETLFHEFGHALQGLMQRCRYRSSGGLNSDYVEVFSQFNEHYAFLPELLAEYARDEAGKPLPDEIVRKLAASSLHNKGFVNAELCAAALLDLRLHMVTDFTGFDLEAFERQVAREAGLIDEIGFRYRPAYFKHIFAGGYSAGYYSYLWSQVLEQDLYSFFRKSGDVWNRALAEKFRRTFFEKGDSEDPMTLFRAFAGRDPDSRAFFAANGLEQ